MNFKKTIVETSVRRHRKGREKDKKIKIRENVIK
jgi:hypothetical protein